MTHHTENPARKESADRLADIIESIEQSPTAPITRKSAKQTEGYAVGDRLFAYIDQQNELVVSLPAMRITAHEQAGTATRAKDGADDANEVMQEWARIGTDIDQGVWSGAVNEAYSFAVAQNPS